MKRLVVIIALGVVAAVVGFVVMNRTTTFPIPDLPHLEKVEARVAARIRDAHDELGRTPSDGTRWRHYARVLDAHGHDTEALQAYLVAAELTDDAFPNLYLAGRLAVDEDLERGIALFEKARGLRPNDVPLLIRLGDALAIAERTDEAEQAFRRSLEIEETSRAWLGLGRLTLRRADPADAAKYLERALALDANDGEIHEALARAYRILGRLKQARRHGALAARRRGGSVPDPFVQAVAAEAVSYRSFENRANRNAERGRLVDARAAIDEALAIRRDFPPALLIKAKILYLMKSDAEAGAVLTAAMNRQKTADGLSLRALLQQRKGNMSSALADVREALLIDPSHIDSRYSLATYLLTSDPTEAEREAREIIRRDPSHGRARALLAHRFLARGETDKARRQLERALADEPNNDLARKMLATLSN